jgi:hypothetical protein
MYIALRELSGKAEDYARRRIRIKIRICKKKADKLIAQMESYYEKVANYNQELAMEYLSEGCVDADYACGRSNYSSLRLSVERRKKMR